MKKVIVASICLGLVIAFPSHSNAAAKKFKNCTELNKVYPGGVALPGAVNAGGNLDTLFAEDGKTSTLLVV